MTDNIILFPNPIYPPLPPTKSIRVVIRTLQSLISRWKILVSKAYAETMPMIVAVWWSVQRTIQAAQNRLPPVIDTVAELRRHMDKSPLRQRARVGMVQNAEQLQLGLAA